MAADEDKEIVGCLRRAPNGSHLRCVPLDLDCFSMTHSYDSTDTLHDSLI